MALMQPNSDFPIYSRISELPAREGWIPQICSWEPVDLLGRGRYTFVTFEQRDPIFIARGCEWIRKVVCYHYLLDLAALRRQYREKRFKVLNVPIVLAKHGLIYIPVKMRNPHNRNEYASGYARIGSMTKLTPLDDTSTRIHLENGHLMDALMSLNCVQRRVSDAETFAFLLHRDNLL